MKNTRTKLAYIKISHSKSFNIIRNTLLLLLFNVFQVVLGNSFSQTANSSRTNSQQSISVTGTITDKNGEPVIGATIQIKGTAQGTIADVSGKFSLTNVSKNGVLIFSYIGMKTQEISVGGNSKINVVLEETAVGIDEVVVVGYGTQSKVSITGAVSSVKMADLKQSPAPNLISALTGRLPGLITIQNNGQPGKEDFEIYLRGAATTNTKTPLILLDGVPSDNSVLATIDPNEIASISILKDASSTAVFGVRGANGVILITTQRGTSEKVQLNITAETGMQSFTTQKDMVDSWDFAVLKNQALQNDGFAPEYSQRQIDLFRAGTSPLYPNTDWWTAITKPFAPMQRYNINASGGNENVKYFINAGYLYQGSMFKTESKSVLGYDPSPKLNRYNFRANLDVKVNSWISGALNIAGYVNQVNSPGSFGGAGDVTVIIQRYYDTQPTLPGPLTVEGMGDVPVGVPTMGATSSDSPYILLNHAGYVRTDGSNINTSLSLKFDLNKITKGLSSKVQVSFNSTSTTNSAAKRGANGYKFATLKEILQSDGSYVDKATWVAYNSPQIYPLTLSKSTSFWYFMNMQWSLNYARKFAQKHYVSGLLLAQRDNKEVAGGSSDNLLPYNILGISGRATYDYDNRYFFEMNVGYNGSEQFHKDRRFGFFPAGSIGWVASNESFMREQDIITHLKFRASYGMVGNDQISSTRFLYLDNVALVSGGFSSSLGEGKKVNEALIGNPDLTWEKAIKQNYGVELELFNDFSINAELFNEDRTDILISRGVVPVLLGLPVSIVPKANLGEINNKGFEIELAYKKKVNKDLYISVGGNFNYNKNTIKFMDEAPYGEGYLYNYRTTNQSIGQSWGYEIDWNSSGKGYFTSQEEIDNYYPYTEGKLPRPGDFVYKDLNGDGEISTKDYAPLKYPVIPRGTFGINANLKYKGFDISLLFQGVTMAAKSYSGWGAKESTGEGIFYTHHLYAWTSERYEAGEDIKYPALSINGSSSNSVPNDYFIVDRSYLRLKNAEIGYTIPKEWCKLIGMQGVRIYVNGQNLLTWDNQPFNHIDPEQADDVAVPILRLMNLGVNIVF